MAARPLLINLSSNYEMSVLLLSYSGALIITCIYHSLFREDSRKLPIKKKMEENEKTECMEGKIRGRTHKCIKQMYRKYPKLLQWYWLKLQINEVPSKKHMPDKHQASSTPALITNKSTAQNYSRPSLNLSSI